MADITTRAGKGSPLENDEVDANFTNLNDDKLEATDLSVSTGAASGGGALSYASGVFAFTPAVTGIENLDDFTTTDLVEGSNLYYTEERVDDRVNALIVPGLGITTDYDDTAGTLTVESDTIEELCKNGTGSTILKGTPVYQTGTSGVAMVIAPADASSAATMPAVGVLSQDLAAEAEGSLILMGRISGVDTSAFSEGDVIYVASGGGYTNTRPTGESVLVQNLGRVTKVNATNGGGVVMGSGRANDVPNLTDGNIFIGNASGTYDKRAIVAADISDLTATATELNYTDGVTSSIQTQLNSKLPSSSYTASDVLTKIKTVDGSGSGLDSDLLDGQQGSYYTGYTDTAIANLVDSAPATLDTLNELAAALGDDPNFATTVTNSIATKAPIASPTFTGTVTIPTASVTGNITVTGTVDGRDVAADGTKLDGIESGATADQTAAEILTAVKTVDGTGSGLDADLLDGQQGSYYYPASNPNGFTTNVGDITGVTAGSYLAGGGTSGTVTLAVDATAGNNASKVVARDASGNFSAGTITAALTGNAATATTLQTARTINGVSFNGSANITVADATKLPLTGGTLTGDLKINKADAAIYLNDSSGSPTQQGMRIRAESIDTNLPNNEGIGIIFEEDPANSSADTTPAVITTGEFYAQSNKQVFHDSYHPNADKWTTARTLSITGAVTGSVAMDGSGNVSLATTATSDPVITLTGAVTGSGTMTNLGNVSITTTATADPTLTLSGDVTGSATFTNLGNATLTAVVADDSHNHIISNVDGLQTALDAKLASSSYTAADVLTKVKTVDGSGSGLDADLLDGQQGSYYTGYTDTAVANLVDSAPATLDTLNELAAALGDDPNFATTVTNSIATKAPLASPTFTGTVISNELKADNGNLILGDTAYSASASYIGMKTSYQSGTNDYMIISGLSDGDTYISAKDGSAVNIRGGGNYSANEIRVPDTGAPTIGGSTIWHEGNDGSGSGLDADLLDGQQGSYYAAASSLSSYLPLAGGTMTGTLDLGTQDIAVDSGKGFVNSGAWTRNQTPYGNIEFGPANTTWAHIYTDRPNFYFNKNLYVENQRVFHDTYHPNADKLTTARTINGVSFDGTANITVADSTKLPLAGGTISGSLTIGAGVTLAESTDRADLLQITSNTSGYGGLQIRNSSNEGRWSFMTDGENAGIYNDEDSQWHILMSEAGGTALYYSAAVKLATTSAGVNITGTATATTFSGALSGNATTATTLQTARTINGVSFNGSANITVADATKLPLTGGTLSGNLSVSGDTFFGYGTLTADSQNDVVLFSADGNTAQSGAFHNKLIIKGGSSQSRDLQLYQQDGGYSWLDTSWTGNSLNISANFTALNVNTTLNIDGNLNAVDNIYLAGSLYHEGDTDTRLVFGTNTVTLQVGGSSEISVSTTGVRLGDTGNGYFQPVSGSYGSIQVDGGAHGGYEGYSIGGRAVFMHNNGGTTGIYNDVENEWLINCTHNAAVSLYYNGTSRLQTTNTGANVTGTMSATAFTGDGSGLTNLPSSGGSIEAVASGALANGDVVVINSDATVSIISGEDGETGSSVTYESNSSKYTSATFDSNSNKVVICYRQNSPAYGYARVGTVSGTSITFGIATIWRSATVDYPSITFDSNANKVVINYNDNGAPYYGQARAIVGTVSGTNISFGTPTTWETKFGTYFHGITFDSNSNKVIVTCRGTSDYGQCAVGTVSGTSISFGTKTTFNSATTNYPTPTFDSNSNKVVIAYPDGGNSSYGTAIVGTVSGTSISFGSSAVFTTGNIAFPSLAFDSNSNKVVIAYRDNTNAIGAAVVGTVSGTSISFGGVATFQDSEPFGNVSCVYDSDAKVVTVSFATTAIGTRYVSGKVSGDGITFGVSIPYYSSYAKESGITFDSNSNRVVSNFINSSNQALLVVIKNSKTNLSGNVLGISDGAYSNGATATIQIVGAIDDAQSGLSIGSPYYVDTKGNLVAGAVSGSSYVGLAISSTEILIKG